MRVSTRNWALISLLCFLGAMVCFWLGNREARRQGSGDGGRKLSPASTATGPTSFNLLSTRPSPARASRHRAQSATPSAQTSAANSRDESQPYRVRNTSKPVSQLVVSDTAILLENGLIDTLEPSLPGVPEALRAEPDAGSYLVQAREPLGTQFYARLRDAGAQFVSYIPNNAALITASAEAAARLQRAPGIRAVLPYDPYYKLSRHLLRAAVDGEPLEAGLFLNVVMFPGQREAGLTAIRQLQGDPVQEGATPFGPMVTVPAVQATLVALARLPGVQRIEPASARVLLNDLTRERLAVSTDTVIETNHFGLTGTNVLVNLNDTGVDASHPDLVGRVFTTDTNGVTLLDTNGHGTHVAGTIASSGLSSSTVTNASGSFTNASFRGMAPGVDLFVLPIESDAGPLVSDVYLQQVAAQEYFVVRGGTNALISNNSWGYGRFRDYTFSSASYDSATRDALPELGGSQPVMFVFAAGDQGFGNLSDDGLGGFPNRILSPATAKNVITVGALEQPRFITNEYVFTNSDGTLTTNQAYYTSTDSDDEVWRESSRGSVGVGIEGTYGRFKPDLVAPGTFQISTRSQNMGEGDTNIPAVGPLYRYESGSSMSAAAVSGMLALMQEFFEQKLQTNWTPALMKALLINSARTVNGIYDISVQKMMNYQGWGLPNLERILPSTLTNLTALEKSPVRYFDGGPDQSLATGERHTWRLTLSTNAAVVPLRATLVWTDPPGNPGAGVKLVNDLDLVVTNLDTGEIFVGNNIPRLGDFTQTSGTNDVPADEFDHINNVENVFLQVPGGTNFSVTVFGRRVNVNADTLNTNDVVQDYALVLSSGDGEYEEPFLQVVREEVPRAMPPPTAITNGVPLLHQRVGGNFQLSASTNGITNQWMFYVFTNYFFTNQAVGSTPMTNGSNVAFITFLPPNISRPRNLQADIDLYVSEDPGLLDLDPTVVAASFKSVGRGGTEVVVFTNAEVGLDKIFYIGVKSEDQQACEYGLIGLSSDLPFEGTDANGNLVLNGMPSGVTIPDGSPELPGNAMVFAVGISEAYVQQVAAELAFTHNGVGDLLGNLSHDDTYAVLNNHNLFDNNGATNFVLRYDDQGGMEINGRPSDGPGSLGDFMGKPSAGVWMFNMTDDALGRTGVISSVTLRIAPQVVVDPILGTVIPVLPNQWRYFFINVPADAIRLDILVSELDGPLNVYLRREAVPTETEYDKAAFMDTPGGVLSLTRGDVPPLNPGLYFVGLYNPGSSIVNPRIRYVITRDQAAANTGAALSPDTPLAIPDDAVSFSTIFVPRFEPVVALEVGLRLVHPRASDLVMHLYSPTGDRVLLSENRGRASTAGYGTGWGTITNLVVAWTNGFEDVLATNYAPGEEFSGWTVTGTNLVSVVENTNLAAAGSRYLALRGGAVEQVLPVVANRTYQFQYASRLNPATNSCIVSWWPGENDATDIADGNDGSFAGNRYAQAKVARGFSFPAPRPGVVSVPNATNLNFGSDQDFSIEAWIRADASAATGERVIVDKRDLPGNRGYALFLSDGKLAFSMADGGAPAGTVWPLGNLADGSFHHVAVTVVRGDPAGGTLYVDGEAKITFAPTMAPGDLSTDQPLLIGSGVSGSGSFIGLIDEPSVYACALPPAQVLDIVQSGTAGKLANVWPPINPTPGALVSIDAGGPLVTNIVVGSGAWVTNVVVFTPTNDLATVSIQTLQPGLLLDTFQLAEIAVVTNVIYTTFTEQTNLAQLPIKFAEAPFTNNLGGVSTNRIVLDDGFEGVGPRVYTLGEGIGGWKVDAGQVAVYGTNNVLGVEPAGGTNFIELQVAGQPSGLGTNLTLQLNRQYQFNLATRRNPLLPPGTPQALGLYTNGGLARLVVVTTTNWVTNSYTLRATAMETTFELRSLGPHGPLVDSVLVAELQDEEMSFYLPEEALKPLLGQPAYGNWTLSLWDNRAGPIPDPLPTLVSWELNFVFANTNPPAEKLVFCRPDTNTVSVYFDECDPRTNVVSGSQIQYFIVEPPRVATMATNLLDGSGDLLLLYNPNGLPTGLQVGDVIVNANAGPGVEMQVLNTNAPPKLRPGERYYLGVANVHPDETNTFTISAAFDRVETNLVTVRMLTNGIPVTNSIPATNALDYYGYLVATNATEVRFTLSPTNGNADLVVRRALPVFAPLPIPYLGRYDYISENTGTNADVIVITPTSDPVPLSPGLWYLGVFNRETNAVGYTILATEFTNTIPIVTLTNGVVYTNTMVATNTLAYFQFTVPANATNTLFALRPEGGNLDLFVRKSDGSLTSLPTPELGRYDYASENLGAEPEFIVLDPTSSPVPLSAGVWFLGVANRETNAVAYSILATNSVSDIFNIVPLVDAVPLDFVLGAGSAPTNFFRFTVPPGSPSVLFEAYNLTGDAWFYAKQNGYPDNTAPWFALGGPGLSAQIVVRTNGLLADVAGDWFLAVVPGAAEVDLGFTIQATLPVNGILPSGVPLNLVTTPLSPPGSGLRFSWFAVAGESYEIQESADLTHWTPIQVITAGGQMVTYDLVPPAGTPGIFYRVQQIPPP